MICYKHTTFLPLVPMTWCASVYNENDLVGESRYTRFLHLQRDCANNDCTFNEYLLYFIRVLEFIIRKGILHEFSEFSTPPDPPNPGWGWGRVVKGLAGGFRPPTTNTRSPTLHQIGVGGNWVATVCIPFGASDNGTEHFVFMNAQSIPLPPEKTVTVTSD